MENKTKRKIFFSNTSTTKKKKLQLHNLKSGMKGFFCTCNYREKECIQEACNILTYYSEKIEDLKKKTVSSKLKKFFLNLNSRLNIYLNVLII